MISNFNKNSAIRMCRAQIAKKIRKAVSEVIQDGKVQTYDMAKMTGREDVIHNGAATTIQMADAIINKL